MRKNGLSAIFGCIMMPLTLLSCGGSVDGSGEIAVAPYTLQAASELSTYDLDVVADCSWTAEIQSADEVEADWLTLSKRKGTGDTKLTLRVFENKYSSERKAVVNFLVGKAVKATVNVTQAGARGGEDMSSADLRVGSYNLRMSSLDDSDAQNKWSVRKSRLLTSIKENDFDIFGVQEVDLTTQQWLRDNLGSEFECWFFSPYAQSGTGDKAQGILFRKNMLSISDKHYFWASDTPDVCSVNDTGDSGNFRRGGHCAIFTHKSTGVRFFFMNTHACLNREPNAAYAYVYADQEKRYNTEGLPSFFVGDMNARPEYDAPAKYKEHWKDSFETAAKRSGAAATYNGYSNASGKYRIDYIFHRGKVNVKEFCINNALYDNLYASDHFHIYADVTITK